MFKRLIGVTLVACVTGISASGQTRVTVAPSSPPAGAMRSDSGVAWTVVNEPTGAVTPADGDFVTINYIGRHESGDVFDTTATHPDVRTFALAKLFPGLRESVASMKIGEKRWVWFPQELSPKQAPVVYEVELLDITRPFDPPSDVAEPSADAERSKSGLAWKVLGPGTGGAHPIRTSVVTVHYTGWTTDGKMFDSSFRKGQPVSFRLDEVIPGWREGLQMMARGEKRRFWIPQKLAYRGQRGMPSGMLVFDVELLRFR